MEILFSKVRFVKIAKIRFVARRVIRDFVKNTGIHGVKYLDDRSTNSGRIVKLFWLFILVLSFIGSIAMLRVFWKRYQNNPMLTVVESFHVPTFIGTFPALTVCSMVPPSLENRLNMLRSLRLPENMTKAEAASLIKNIFELTHPRSDQFEEHVKMDKILRANRMEMLDFLKRLRGHCNDMFESCWWNENEMSCEKLMKLSYSYDGLCCSFNYNLEDTVDLEGTGRSTADFIHTASYGLHSGLTLVFKGHQFILNHDNGTIARITTNTVGLILYIHHSHQYPISFNRILQAGREMQLGIVPRRNIREPGISRKTEVPCATSTSTKIKYFSIYEPTNCHNSCKMKAALGICGCVPWQFAPFTKLEQIPICDFLRFKCIQKNYRKVWSAMYVNEMKDSCVCPESCKGGEFLLKHSQIPIASTRFTPSIIYHNISEKNAVLRIFMAHQVFEDFGSVKITNEVYMLSSIGGIFSLFLGCSILSIGEIVYFFLILIYSCYSISKKASLKKRRTVQRYNF